MPQLAPLPPDVPAAHRSTGALHLRYEDVTQDGYLAPLTLSSALGEVVWRNLAAHDRASSAALREQGVIPILTRLVMQGGEGPISIGNPVEIEGRFQMGHAADDAGAVTHILVRMWASASAIRESTFGGRPPGPVVQAAAGSIYAEHVMTRLFAPKGERKVLALEAPGIPRVPPHRVDVRPPRELLVPPEGATSVAPLSDAAAISFGVGHTDSNQHVNSLVYPRLFEDAALRRLGALGKGTARRAISYECAYRKPCFAGENVRIVLGTYDADGTLWAAGAFVEQNATSHERAHAYVRIGFSQPGLRARAEPAVARAEDPPITQ